MKTTPFTDIHIALGAKMHEFAGYNMPIEYPTGITAEHLAVCYGVGVFDVSHMGEFWVKGKNAQKFLQRVCSNDIASLAVGKAQYNCFPNGNGGIVDDLIVYHYEDEKYMLVVNAANIDKDWAWVNKNKIEGVELENSSDNIAQLAIQGPKATALLQELTAVKLENIPYYAFEVGEFAEVKDVIISNTGYTGAGGFELYFYRQYGEKIWNAIFEAGKKYDIKPVGLGARDTLRLEVGFCLYGHEIDDTTSPIEAGLGWITKPSEGKNLIDGELYTEQRKNGVKMKLAGFELKERAIPRQDYELTDGKGTIIGRVTSGCMSPTAKIGVGMGYVKPEFSKLGTEIAVLIRGKEVRAEVVKPPFRRL
ncbi:MAG: glycine cleavage system aminomethyltransferase GcvT [Prevotellaceae bacterium]|jgi:aminomethyltransferase|nr:glycine cleavage system aminomethyltransferase GcvT [Prevotellaceae bacterium]